MNSTQSVPDEEVSDPGRSILRLLRVPDEEVSDKGRSILKILRMYAHKAPVNGTHVFHDEIASKTQANLYHFLSPAAAFLEKLCYINKINNSDLDTALALWYIEHNPKNMANNTVKSWVKSESFTLRTVLNYARATSRKSNVNCIRLPLVQRLTVMAVRQAKAAKGSADRQTGDDQKNGGDNITKAPLIPKGTADPQTGDDTNTGGDKITVKVKPERPGLTRLANHYATVCAERTFGKHTARPSCVRYVCFRTQFDVDMFLRLIPASVYETLLTKHKTLV